MKTTTWTQPTPGAQARLAQAATGGPVGLLEVRALANLVSESFLAKASVIAAESGSVKVSALLLAVLAARDVEMLSEVFDRAVRNPETLRRYVAFLRSGYSGRRSFGTRPKKLIQDWLNACPVEMLKTEAFLFRPSLADIVRMTHPKPVDLEHQRVFGWMLGRPVGGTSLPCSVGSRRERTRLLPPQLRRLRAVSRVEGVEL